MLMPRTSQKHSCAHRVVKARRASKGEVYAWLHNIADKGAPKLRAAVLRAFREGRAKVDSGAFIAAWRSGGASGVTRVMDNAFDALTAAVKREAAPVWEDVFTRAARTAAGKATPLRGTVGFSFDMTNPQSIEYLRRYRMGLVREVTNETRLAIRDVVLRGFREGRTAEQMAAEIKNLVGLTRRQSTAAMNYRDALIEEGRALPQITRMTEAYSNRVLNQRAETIARTETIRAAGAGREALWRQAQEQGVLVAGARRYWIVTEDDRLCPICEAIPDMNPDGVGLNESFRTSDGPLMQEPAHPNCRCAVELVA